MGFSKVVTDVADAGGTRPFVVEANRNLTRLLQEAFNEIRSLTVACEYTIPAPSAGAVDFGKVNVHLQSAMIDEDIPYVASADRCDSTRNGWYYDADPATGGTPTRVVLCPPPARASRTTPAARWSSASAARPAWSTERRPPDLTPTLSRRRERANDLSGARPSSRPRPSVTSPRSAGERSARLRDG